MSARGHRVPRARAGRPPSTSTRSGGSSASERLMSSMSQFHDGFVPSSDGVAVRDPAEPGPSPGTTDWLSGVGSAAAWRWVDQGECLVQPRR